MARPFFFWVGMIRSLVLSGALALAVVACSRGPTVESRGGSGVKRTGSARPVLFVGLDGADWQMLDEEIARGAMPNLARIVREGQSGVLETIRPPLSPLIWTTMMTGVSPLDHGILDFVQFDPENGAKEPITSTMRRVPAIWNMASAAGLRSATFGLWATYPAETVNGTIVSDRLFTFLFKESAPPVGVVFPPDRESWARTALDRAERTTNEIALRAYLPWLTDAEYREHANTDDPYAHPISALRRILIETRVYDELGRDAFERDHPDLTVLYLQGTDTIGHVFAPFAPPKQPAVSEADFERYSEVPDRYFRLIDERLGEYRRLIENARGVLMLASDHGFFWKEGRPTTLSSNANTTAAKWHRNEGIYALWGAGIGPSAGHTARGSVQQVCATLLALLGLAPGRGLQGPALPGTPVDTRAPAAVDYTETFRRPAAGAAKEGRDADALAKLKSLGYVGDSGPATSRTLGATRTPGSYNNEGIILKEKGREADAIAAFDNALALDPNLASALWNLSDLLFAKKDFDRSDALLVKAFANGLPDGPKFL